jgi:hypothetical protein
MNENKTAKTPADAEPVAYVHLEKWLAGLLWPEDAFNDIEIEGMTPLYTAPPKREWVGLTDDEFVAILIEAGERSKGMRELIAWLAKAIEAKLKEKNT